jgi:predicted phosphodiesterase
LARQDLVRDLRSAEESAIEARVGIMADSHGEPHKIIAAARFLNKKGCRLLFHLGDICDSAHPETVEPCVRALKDLAVTAVRGNNDHLILVNHLGQTEKIMPPDILDFLQSLPLVVKYHIAILTHSLPFLQELGLSSMVSPMDRKQTARFFDTYPDRILFRGHSHSPEIWWEQDLEIISQILRVGQRIDLTDRIPCVVSCGALTQRVCILWEPHENMIEYHAIQ